MYYEVFSLRTDVNACDCTWGCTDTIRESSLKVDCGRKIPCRTLESNLHQGCASLMRYQLSYIPIPKDKTQWNKPLRLNGPLTFTYFRGCLQVRPKLERKSLLALSWKSQFCIYHWKSSVCAPMKLKSIYSSPVKEVNQSQTGRLKQVKHLVAMVTQFMLQLATEDCWWHV